MSKRKIYRPTVLIALFFTVVIALCIYVSVVTMKRNLTSSSRASVDPNNQTPKSIYEKFKANSVKISLAPAPPILAIPTEDETKSASIQKRRTIVTNARHIQFTNDALTVIKDENRTLVYPLNNELGVMQQPYLLNPQTRRITGPASFTYPNHAAITRDNTIELPGPQHNEMTVFADPEGELMRIFPNISVPDPLTNIFDQFYADVTPLRRLFALPDNSVVYPVVRALNNDGRYYAVEVSDAINVPDFLDNYRQMVFTGYNQLTNFEPLSARYDGHGVLSWIHRRDNSVTGETYIELFGLGNNISLLHNLALKSPSGQMVASAIPTAEQSDFKSTHSIVAAGVGITDSWFRYHKEPMMQFMVQGVNRDRGMAVVSLPEVPIAAVPVLEEQVGFNGDGSYKWNFAAMYYTREYKAAPQYRLQIFEVDKANHARSITHVSWKSPLRVTGTPDIRKVGNTYILRYPTVNQTYSNLLDVQEFSFQVL